LTGVRRIFYEGGQALKKVGKQLPPDNALEAMARCLLPAIVEFFESDEGKREFAEWKEKQDSETAEVQSEKI